jgi:hypothetical protein
MRQMNIYREYNEMVRGKLPRPNAVRLAEEVIMGKTKSPQDTKPLGLETDNSAVRSIPIFSSNRDVVDCRYR